MSTRPQYVSPIMWDVVEMETFFTFARINSSKPHDHTTLAKSGGWPGIYFCPEQCIDDEADDKIGLVGYVLSKYYCMFSVRPSVLPTIPYCSNEICIFDGPCVWSGFGKCTICIVRIRLAHWDGGEWPALHSVALSYEQSSPSWVKFNWSMFLGANWQ